jgi:hypothetical protein
VTAAAAVTLGVLPGAASATVQIPGPPISPFKVPSNALGQPVPFTIQANGFAPGALVFLEVCDGTPSTAVGWNPNINCDLGTAPAAVAANASGVALFPAGDPNKQFKPFRGASPQGMFNCLNALDPSPNNSLPDFMNCQVRISTNNTASTSDQQFFTMQLPTGFTTNIGACNGFKALGKFVAPLSNTNQSLVLSTSLMKDLGTVGAPAINGTCTTTQAPGFPVLHPKAVAIKLLGSASCLPALAPAYPLNGKASITMLEINPATTKPWQIQAFLRIAGTNASAPDVSDVTGIVIKGPAVGATVLGSIAQSPVSKVLTVPNPKPVGYTGYAIDLAKGAACQAGTGTIDTVQITTGTSMLGGFATGLQYGF